MTSVVLDWVNEELTLSDEVTSPEVQFRNGYLLGEVLYVLKLIDDATFRTFKDTDHEEDKLRNFEIIDAVCRKNLKLRYDTKIFSRIWTEEYGSAVALLAKIRDAVSKKSQAKPSAGPNKALFNVRPHPYVRQPLSKSARVMDPLERILEEIGLSNFQALDMAITTKRFEDERVKLETKADADLEKVATIRATELRQERLRALQQLKGKHELYIETRSEGRKTWANNMKTHRDNIRRLLQYQNYLMERKRLLEQSQGARHRQQEEEGITWFEMNLLRLGMGDDGSKGAEGKARPTKEDSFTFLDRIRDTYLQEEAKRGREAGDLMASLHEKARVRYAVTKEKEVRRRKEMCDQLEEQRATEAMNAVSLRMSADGATSGEAASPADDEDDDLVESSPEAIAEALAKLERDKEAAVQRFIDGLKDEAAAEEERRSQWRAAYKARREAETKTQHEANEQLATEMARYLVDFAMFASDEKLLRSANNEPEPLNQSQWAYLKELFLAGYIFYESGQEGSSQSPRAEAEEEAQRQNQPVDVVLHAEAFLWWHDSQYGLGSWRIDSEVPALGNNRPEDTILEVVNSLMADDKPNILPKRPSQPPLAKPLQFILIGPRPDLLSVGRSLCELNNLLLVTTDIAIQCAQKMAAEPLKEDPQQSGPRQAMVELGQRYIATTTDPKTPAPPSDQLVAELVTAYIRLQHGAGGTGWLLVGFPSSGLQAKLLERALTGYTDTDIEEYLVALAKAEKSRGVKGAGKPIANKTASKGSKGASGTLHDGPVTSTAFDAVFCMGVMDPLMEAFWKQLDEPTSKHVCHVMQDEVERSEEYVLNTLDILIECVTDHRLSKEDEENASTQASIHSAESLRSHGSVGVAPTSAQALPESSEVQVRKDWAQELVSKRAERASRLSLAGQLWLKHVTGEHVLDLEAIRCDIVDSWNQCNAAYRDAVHEAFVGLIASLRPVRTLEYSRHRRLANLIHAPLPAYAHTCKHALRELRHLCRPWDVVCNDLEVSLGDAVERRYDEASDYVVQAGEMAWAEVGMLMVNLESTLGAYVAAEASRLEARCKLITSYERHTGSVAGEDIADASHMRDALAEAKQSVLAEVNGLEPSDFRQQLAASVHALDDIVERHPHAGGTGRLTAVGFVSVVRRTLAFYHRVSTQSNGFRDQLTDSLREMVRGRVGRQYSVIRSMIAQMEGGGKEVALLLLDGGEKRLELDESQRMRPSFGVSVVDTGLSYIPPQNLSALIYALKVKAARSSTLKRDSFVRCVTEAAKKAGAPVAWQDVDRVRRVVQRLDPASTGVISWGRFVHAAVCGLLPRLPTLEEILNMRAAAVKLAGDTAAYSHPLSPIRVTSNQFLDLPIWFETEMDKAMARSIKELYALAFADEDGNVTVNALLLALCQDQPTGAGADCWHNFSLPSSGLIKAVVVFGNSLTGDLTDTAGAARAYDVRAGVDRKSRMISAAVLEQILMNSTYLYTVDAARRWLGEVYSAAGVANGADVSFQTLLVSEVVRRSEDLFAVPNVYV